MGVCSGAFRCAGMSVCSAFTLTCMHAVRNDDLIYELLHDRINKMVVKFPPASRQSGAPAAVSELLQSMLGSWSLVPDAQVRTLPYTRTVSPERREERS